MGKLSEIVNKGVRLIVSDPDSPPPEESDGAAPSSPPPPPSMRRSTPAPPETIDAAPPRRVTHSDVPAETTDFAAVYQEAGIELPAHGYGIEKVAEMLESKRLAPLAREVRATAVLAAVEAAGAPIRDVIQDAVRRDKALDAFEAAKEHEAQEIRAKNETEIKELNAQIEDMLKKVNAKIEELKAQSEAAARAFTQLQARKRKEEERLHDIVSHFIEGGDNPITTSKTAPPPPPPPPKTGPA
jgi:hypothetical protein